MDNLQQLLQISAQLFKTLEIVPKGEERSELIDKVNAMLDQRGIFIEQLKEVGFQLDSSNKSHVLLAQLDEGIRKRLDVLFRTVKQDMKDIQNSKKNEKQYMNPYANVRVMDGMYYDRKK